MKAKFAGLILSLATSVVPTAVETTMHRFATIGRRCVMSLAMGVSMCAFLAGHASAIPIGSYVTIDDSVDGGLSFVFTNWIDFGTIAVTQEGNGILGTVDKHYTFLSAFAPPPGGATVVNNYNIYDLSGQLSDTLSIAVTGVIGGGNVISVNLHFVSDSADEIAPVLLAGGTSITENGLWQQVDSGIADLNVQFRSDVSETPLPAALPLFATGLGGLGLLGWRRKRKKAAAIVA